MSYSPFSNRVEALKAFESAAYMRGNEQEINPTVTAEFFLVKDETTSELAIMIPIPFHDPMGVNASFSAKDLYSEVTHHFEVMGRGYGEFRKSFRVYIYWSGTCGADCWFKKVE